LTTLTNPDVLKKDCLFPSQTEKELIAKYPEQAPSASQWDKKFSSYLDDIWERIADTEKWVVLLTMEWKFAESV
jgi:hypothetical protein